MSENRFACCDAIESVLSHYVVIANRAGTFSETTAAREQAAARIRELTQPPVCGATAIICLCEFVCDQPPHGDDTDHLGSDSVGWMRWRDTDKGVVVTGAASRDGWPVR